MGIIQSILIRPEKKGPVAHLTAAHIHAHGIEGNHPVRPESKRAVTLIAADQLAEAAASIGFQGDAHGASRRNICVDSWPGSIQVGQQIALGEEVIVEVTCYCAPCNRMDENLGEGAIDALDQKAGWGAIVIREGDIMVGDAVRLL